MKIEDIRLKILAEGWRKVLEDLFLQLTVDGFIEIE